METKEVTIVDLVKIAARWVWLLVACAVICAGIAFFYSENVVQPAYSAKTRFLIQTNKGNENDLLDSQRKIAYAQLVVGTYIDILNTRNFAEEISFYMNGYVHWDSDSDKKIVFLKELGLAEGTVYGNRKKEYTPDEVKRKISYSTTEESTTFTVSVVSGDYKEAYAISRCIELVISDYINSKYPGVGEVVTIDKAVENPNPINNNTVLYTLIGFIAGFAVAFVCAYIIELADNRIKNEKELAEKTGLSIVGIIPDTQLEKGATTTTDKRIR